jgi:hypothetical protein
LSLFVAGYEKKVKRQEETKHMAPLHHITGLKIHTAEGGVYDNENDLFEKKEVIYTY